MLAVSDGCGMDREDPRPGVRALFATKGPGLGTGLGLATVYGIVKRLYQRVQRAGRGTTFASRERRGAGWSARGTNRRARRQRTILLVEDEPALLALGTRQLALLGYNVLPAATPTGPGSPATRRRIRPAALPMSSCRGWTARTVAECGRPAPGRKDAACPATPPTPSPTAASSTRGVEFPASPSIRASPRRSAKSSTEGQLDDQRAAREPQFHGTGSQ